MKADPGLQPTRDVREKISRELDNDPRRLVGYYIEYQRRFVHRLRPAPTVVPNRDEADEACEALDEPSSDA